MAHPDFNPPAAVPKLTARSSTLTGLFVVSVTPYIEPSEEEVDKALRILGMRRGRCVCAYCGHKKSEWDHFRAVIKDRKPTGYITDIANLVPACGKCNQSRGNRDWRDWIRSDAPHARAARRRPGLPERIQRLEDYERLMTPRRIDYKELVGTDRWTKHMRCLEQVFAVLRTAENHAKELRTLAKAAVGGVTLSTTEIVNSGSRSRSGGRKTRKLGGSR